MLCRASSHTWSRHHQHMNKCWTSMHHIKCIPDKPYHMLSFHCSTVPVASCLWYIYASHLAYTRHTPWYIRHTLGYTWHTRIHKNTHTITQSHAHTHMHDGTLARTHTHAHTHVLVDWGLGHSAWRCSPRCPVCHPSLLWRTRLDELDSNSHQSSKLGGTYSCRESIKSVWSIFE